MFFTSAQNTCQTAQLLCPNPTSTYSGNVNAADAFPGPYDCLGSSPNPSWHYLQVATGGLLELTISGLHDIDYICWGPFNSLASCCASLTIANVIDCSYSSSNTETLTLTNANTGEFYMIMSTNFSNVVQTITVTQQSGNAVLNCNVTGVFKKDNAFEKIKVYPNPSHNFLNIQIDYQDKEFKEAQIINCFGEVVKTKELFFINHQSTIDLPDLPYGVYLLRLIDETGNDQITAIMIENN